MKLLYPNKTAVESKKIFIYKIGGREYLFYTTGESVNGLTTVCFGELKENSLFAVAADDLETFKLFLGDFANNRASSNANYVLEPVGDQEVTIYGGAKSQIASNIVDAIVSPVPAPAYVAPVTPAPYMSSPVMKTPKTAEPQVIKETNTIVKEVPTYTEPTPNPVTPEPVMDTPVTPDVAPEKPKKKGVPFVAILAIILLIAIGGYLFYEYYFKDMIKNNAPTTSTSTSESKSVVVSNINLTCTKNDTSVTKYSKENIYDITFDATTGNPTTVIESNKYVFANTTDYNQFVTTDKAKDRSADVALGISYTTFPNEAKFTYTTMKSVLKASVADTTWATYTTNYKTLTATQTYFTAQGYICTMSE